MLGLGTNLVNWSGQQIPDAEMMVMRRVAIEIITTEGITEVEFKHHLCAGIVRHVKSVVYGGAGGQLFFGDFGAKNNQPNTVDFFIPRHAINNRPRHALFGQLLKRDGDDFVSAGTAYEIDEVTASGGGKLTMTVRR